MQLAFSIVYYALLVIFMGVYIASFIVNLIRAIKGNKEFKRKPESVKGQVIDIHKDNKTIYVKVEFVSPASRHKFLEIFRKYLGSLAGYTFSKRMAKLL